VVAYRNKGFYKSLNINNLKLKVMQLNTNANRVMESGNHFKNGVSLKSLMSSTLLLSLVFVLNSCGAAKLTPEQTRQLELERQTGRTITINSEPSGARVIANGTVVCSSTPCTVTLPPSTMGKVEFTFIKEGYLQGKETRRPNLRVFENKQWGGREIYDYPDVFHTLKKDIYATDPTIRAGEATNMVTRDNPGGTALERTIIRWYFDSDPRGARIFWRVISSVPDQVKNTNELYLTSTPYEETRSFNILGLTYENSRDVVIEIKVTRTGYMDQVKRYNVRQAIDQQEISGFFELVKQ